MDEFLRLAEEGERAARSGDQRRGIELLERAIKTTTDDAYLLSAVYSQLGNAYYSQKDYKKALEYHVYDLMLSKTLSDNSQLGKALSNLSLTYTTLGQFERAVNCGENVIHIAEHLNDEGLKCRGYYILGFAYLHEYYKKRSTSEGHELLKLAIDNFKCQLQVAEQREDEVSRTLAIGNLGSSFHYLGEYSKAIQYHSLRLEIARAVGDKTGMRRCHTNIGNAYILLGQFDAAADSYNEAMKLAKEQKRQHLEAQIAFSLGNTESLRNNYNKAVTFHLEHLRIARALGDSAGEARANSSVASDFVQLRKFPKALYFLVKNYELARKFGDETAERNALEDIKNMVQANPESVVENGRVVLDSGSDPEVISLADLDTSTTSFSTLGSAQMTSSMPNMALTTSLESLILEYVNGTSAKDSSASTGGDSAGCQNSSTLGTTTDCGISRTPLSKSLSEVKKTTKPDEEFFEMLSRMQSKRLDDQRCDAGILKDCVNNDISRQSDTYRPSLRFSENPDAMFDLIVNMQGRRMEEQRAQLEMCPGLNNRDQILEKHRRDSKDDVELIDERLYNLILQSQSDRLEDQRSNLGGMTLPATIEENDVSDLVLRMQAGRLDEQRAEFKAPRDTTSDKAPLVTPRS